MLYPKHRESTIWETILWWFTHSMQPLYGSLSWKQQQQKHVFMPKKHGNWNVKDECLASFQSRNFLLCLALTIVSQATAFTKRKDLVMCSRRVVTEEYNYQTMLLANKMPTSANIIVTLFLLQNDNRCSVFSAAATSRCVNWLFLSAKGVAC